MQVSEWAKSTDPITASYVILAKFSDSWRYGFDVPDPVRGEEYGTPLEGILSFEDFEAGGHSAIWWSMQILRQRIQFRADVLVEKHPKSEAGS